jgi:SnoaL-like domain
MRPSSATDPGGVLVAALAERDFPRLARVLAPDVRLRALLPPGLVEIAGADAAAARFSAWFGDAEELQVVCSGSEPFSDRLHVFYRLRVTKPGNPPRLVEQHLLCGIDGGRIAALDLVCTGFRPDDAAEHAATG